MSSRVVLVTGGATGIGAAVARRVIAEGAAVVIAGRRRDVGREAAADLSRDGGPAMFVAADVTVEAEVSALVEATVTEFGRLDGAFSNAGGVNAPGAVPALDSQAWHADLNQNLTSVFYSLKYQIPASRPRPDGARSSTTPRSAGSAASPAWQRTRQPSTAWSA